jgi:hypothetical protein
MQVRALASRAGCALVVVVGVVSQSAHAQLVVPSTENFALSSNGWYNGDLSAQASLVAAGGPASSASFARVAFSFENATSNPQTPPVVFQTKPLENASGNRFFGNWVTGGVSALSFSVRHNVPSTASGSPSGLGYFVRFASANNFPGATAVSFTPVAPNTWTTLTIPISALSPNFVSFESTNFATVFANIGKLQFGVAPTSALIGTTTSYSFDFTSITIVPSPSSGVLLGALGLVAMRRRR